MSGAIVAASKHDLITNIIYWISAVKGLIFVISVRLSETLGASIKYQVKEKPVVISN